MKKLVVLVIALTLCSCAFADPWTRQDTLLQVGVTGLTCIDWLQTRSIANQPDKFYEAGAARLFIGKHPSTKAVDCYFICSIVSKALGTYILPQEYRPWWQSFCMGASTAVIIHNDEVGIEISKAF